VSSSELRDVVAKPRAAEEMIGEGNGDARRLDVACDLPSTASTAVWNHGPSIATLRVAVVHSRGCEPLASADVLNGACSPERGLNLAISRGMRWSILRNAASNPRSRATAYVLWLAALTSACSHVDDEVVASSSAATATPSQGRWLEPIPLPLVPAAAANVDGKLLLWAAANPLDLNPPGTGVTYTATFDPATGTAFLPPPVVTGHDMFCPGTTNLADGRLLVNGGSNAEATSIYDPVAGTWGRSMNMAFPRGYQANTILADGSVLTLGGSWSGARGGKTGEVWSPNGWRTLPALPVDASYLGDDSEDTPVNIYRADNHMWLFSQANGLVLHAGPGPEMHWIDATWRGSSVAIGGRGVGATLDPYAINGTVVMYAAGKMLKVGGGPGYQETPTRVVDGTSSAHLIEVDGNTVTARQLAATMREPRAFHNSVVLPNGEVLIVGGMTKPLLFSDTGAVMTPELWSPVTEQFTPLPAMTIPRTYHSIAVLLPDARVFVAGGGLCGACTTNHPDAEIFTPHYLLNADMSPAARPRIVSAPPRSTFGESIQVEADGPIQSFSLIRQSSVTHSVNNDQRRIDVVGRPTAPGSSTYVVDIPGNRGLVPPGKYMLFAMNDRGTPSQAHIILINDCADGTPTSDAACAPVADPPDLYVWRFFSDLAYRPDYRSDYRYVRTVDPQPPLAPVGYIMDVTAPSYTFRAWSTPAPGRAPVISCRNPVAGTHWLGVNGCLGDEEYGVEFYAYTNPVRGSAKVLHYLSGWGGKLLIPAVPDNAAQIDGLDADPGGWTPFVDRIPGDVLPAFWVAAP